MNYLNKILITVLIILVGSSLLSASEQTGKVRTFKNVNGVAILGSGDAKIVHGNKNEVSIHAPAEFLPYLITEVDGGTLEIGKRKKGFNKKFRITEPIKYRIIVKDIDHLKIAGSGNINADKLYGDKCYVKVSGSGNISLDDIDGDKTTISVSGSGDIEVNKVYSDELSVTISGSGDIEVGGEVDELDLTISGSGDFDAANLNTDKATVNVYGSGDATFRCRDDLQALITGSGDVTCYGNPSVRSRTTGSGDVTIR